MSKVSAEPTLSRSELVCLLRACYVVQIEEPGQNVFDVMFNLDFSEANRLGFDMPHELVLGVMDGALRDVFYSFTQEELLEATFDRSGNSLTIGSGENRILLTFMMPVRLRKPA